MARRPIPLHRLRRPVPALGLRALLGPDAPAARQSLVALALNSCTALVAGAILGSITDTFEELPGLLVLVPAAIGLRGNTFSTLGNRLSTASHAGTLRFSSRRDSLLGQNVLASLLLSLSMSAGLAVIAKLIAVALGLENTISVLDLAVISVVGGMLASAVVLVSTVGLAGGAVRYGWDLDNVVAPLVSTAGDLVTLPALFLATFLVGFAVVTPALGAVLIAASLVAVWWGLRSGLRELRTIMRQSIPILLVAAAISAMAGITIEKRLDSFTSFPALLILLPAFLSSTGALGGILSSRLASKLHLGLVAPSTAPQREAQREAVLITLLAVPTLLSNGVGAHYVAEWLGQATPGLGRMVAVTMLGGGVALAAVLAIAYYGTIAAFRLGVDPDTYGIPVVTSSVDLVGAFALVLAIVAVGIV